MKIRTGIGYDVHKLVEDRPLILGGVTVPHEFGLLGHSDADVLIHAICDALLGAANLGDIGQLFPDTDLKYANIDSRILLRKTADLLYKKGFSIGNIDATIVAQKPKLMGHIPQMVANIASDLKLSSEDVSVKATTTEWLGFEGREEGISSLSTCLIYAS